MEHSSDECQAKDPDICPTESLFQTFAFYAIVDSVNGALPRKFVKEISFMLPSSVIMGCCCKVKRNIKMD